MRQFSRKLWKVLHNTNRPIKAKKTRPPVQLTFERLEDRTTPTATGTGTITGVAFLDGNGNGIFDAGEVVMPAVQVTLTGATVPGAAVKIAGNTAANGFFSFANVLPGTYELTAGPIPGLLNGTASLSGISGPADVYISSPLSLVGGQSIIQNLGFHGGLAPSFISMRQFLTSSNGTDFPFGAGAPGSGTTPVNSRPNNAPVVSTAIANVSVALNAAPTLINLAGHFSDPDLANSQITLNTNDGPLNITLFDAKAPQTVANFYDYTTSGAYNSAIFSRLVSGFVLQGGGLAVSPSGTGLTPVPVNTAVPSEFGISNTTGTIAMALSAGNPNSGTNQFFIHLVNNNARGTTNLDAQSFTVFGQLGTDATTAATLAALVATPVQNQASSPTGIANSSVDLSNVPLNNYTGSNFAADATASNFLEIKSVTIDSRPEFLTYSVVSDSNPGLVTATISNEHLTLAYATGKVGSATITLQATDTFGATVQQTFTVTVDPSAPVVSATTVTADNNGNATVLTANPTATDPQSLPITFAYQWLHNGATISGATSQTLALNTVTVAKNDTFSVKVTPSDSLIAGAAFTSPVSTVTGTSPTTFATPPVVSAVAISANVPAAPTILTATPTATDPQGLSVSFAYQWLHNGTVINGATAQTLTLSTLTLAKNDTISVRVTPSDTLLIGTRVTSPTVSVAVISPTTLAIGPPVVSAATIAANSPATSLTVTPTANDPQGLTINFAYQWLQNGTAIGGATSATLDLTSLTVAKNDTFSVQITPSDSAFTGAQFTSSTVTATGTGPTTIGTPPIVTAATITADNPNVATKLTANPTATDPQSLTMTFAYQWLQNGTVIGGANAQTLDLTTLSVAKNDTFSVQITPSDSQFTGALFTSPTVKVTGTAPNTLAISPPVVGAATIAANNSANATSLMVTPTATDPQNLPIAFTYQWLQNGAAIGGATTQTLDLTKLTVAQSDTFSVKVTPTDSDFTGAVFTSPIVNALTTNPTTIG